MIKNFLRKFMTGRYGQDQLNIGLVIFSLFLYLIFGITRITPIVYISYVFLGLSIFRMLSRNLTRRRAENDKFIRYWWPIKTKIKRRITGLKSRRTHKFFKCPSCRNTLRVPKGKGKLQVTCPKCGERFFKKT